MKDWYIVIFLTEARPLARRHIHIGCMQSDATTQDALIREALIDGVAGDYARQFGAYDWDVLSVEKITPVLAESADANLDATLKDKAGRRDIAFRRCYQLSYAIARYHMGCAGAI